jgi:hypothetical protein
MTCTDPSAARRKALRDADRGNIMKVIETFPIEKYYAATDRLLLEFDQALDERRLDDAYVYGIRFATFSIDSLPKHKHYKRQHNSLRLKNSRQVDRVLKKLESVTARMDAEELGRQRELQANNEEEQEQEQETLKEQHEGRKKGKETRQDVEQSAKDKLQALQMQSDRDFATKQKQPRGEAAKKQQAKAAAEEGTMLVQERKRLREQTERLAKQQHEQRAKDELLAREERELKAREEKAKKCQARAAAEELAVQRLLARAEEEGQKKAAQERERLFSEERAQAAARLAAMEKEGESTPATASAPISRAKRPFISSFKIKPTKKKQSSEPRYKPTRMSAEEERTIELLHETIAKQEVRLSGMEERKEIHALLREAKSKLTAGDRKGAVRCMARKNGLERSIESVKGAIFTMETQILLLESAVENREVSKAMKAATEAMQSLHVDMSDADFDDMTHAMEEMEQGVANDIIFDEEELLSELLASPTSDVEVPDEYSLVSLPTVPSAEIHVPAAVAAEKSGRQPTRLMDWL